MKRFIVLISMVMFLFSAAIAAGSPDVGVNHGVKLMPGIVSQNQMGVAINAITLPGQIPLINVIVAIDGTNNYIASNSVAKVALIGRAGKGQIINEVYFPDNMQRRTCMEVAVLSPQSEITDYKNFTGIIFIARFGAVFQPGLLTTEVEIVKLWRTSDLRANNGNLFVYREMPAWVRDLSAEPSLFGLVNG